MSQPRCFGLRTFVATFVATFVGPANFDKDRDKGCDKGLQDSLFLSTLDAGDTPPISYWH
jgi:hypothetical protein